MHTLQAFTSKIDCNGFCEEIVSHRGGFNLGERVEEERGLRG